MVHVGFGGDKNFAQHEAGKKHQKKLAADTSNKTERQSTFMTSFFAKKLPSPSLSNSQHSQPVMSSSTAPASLIPRLLVPSEEPINVDSFPDIATTSMPSGHSAVDNLLNRLRVLTSNLPDSVLVAGPEDIFACFAHDPCTEVEEGQDPYEVTVDRTLSNAVGYEKQADDVAQLIRRGPLGMDAFCTWIEICLVNLGIAPGLLEMRVQRVCEAMKIVYVIIYHICHNYS